MNAQTFEDMTYFNKLDYILQKLSKKNTAVTLEPWEKVFIYVELAGTFDTMLATKATPDKLYVELYLEAMDTQYKRRKELIIDKNLCDSCITKGCIFQSGIVRNHCDFYKAESEDKE